MRHAHLPHQRAILGGARALQRAHHEALDRERRRVAFTFVFACSARVCARGGGPPATPEVAAIIGVAHDVHTKERALALAPDHVQLLQHAQAGRLRTLYDGVRPHGYEVMQKQGAIILGIGGDNSDAAMGSFFEGVMTAGYTSDEADDAVHADIVAAGYA